MCVYIYIYLLISLSLCVYIYIYRYSTIYRLFTQVMYDLTARKTIDEVAVPGGVRYASRLSPASRRGEDTRGFRRRGTFPYILQ